MKDELTKIIEQAVKDLFDVPAAVQLSRTTEQFGDYSCNVAMALAGQLGLPPRDIATKIVGNLSQAENIDKIDIAGPGFINLTLTSSALLSMSTSELSRPLAGKTVVIETNNPNPFKAMHIGHAFNAIVADTIANLIEAGGAATYRVSYHGDVGAHVGKSMYSLLKFVDGDPDKLKTVPEAERNSLMSKMYAEGAKAYKEDPSAKAEIDELAKQSFTREDAVYSEVYDICKEWSFEQIDQLVNRLGNRPTERRFLESEADARGVPIVKANVPKVFQESDGALVFEGSKHGSFDNVFVASNGLGLYGARDLGLIKLKDEYYHPDKSLIVTAEEQKDYFKGVLAAANLCMPEAEDVTMNISTGTVKLSTGKMSSRTGEVVEVAWLFDQIEAAIKQRGDNTNESIITGAIRYQFLKVRVGSDVVFDINESVSIHGNSGPYLQYAHARARSIVAKAKTAADNLDNLQPDERSLLRKVSEYPEVVEQAINDLLPSSVCTYLYELAQTFNSFYEHNRVLDNERQAIRLKIVQLYADTLKSGLNLLGIEAPDRM